MKAISLPVLCLTSIASLPAQDPTQARVDPIALAAHHAAVVEAPPHGGSNPNPPPPTRERPARDCRPGDANSGAPPADIPPPAPRNGPSTPPATPGATGPAPRTGSSPRGIPLADLQDSSWTQWWDWNRDNFEGPQPLAVPVDRTTAAAPVRATAERVLVSLCASSNSVERSAAVQALGRIGANPELLRGHLEDPAREVRFATLLGLGSAGSAAHTHALISQTRNQPDEEVLSVAFAGLAMTHEGALARTIDATLEPSLDDARPEVAAAAALARCALGAPGLRAKALATLKTGKSPLNRAVAAQSLGEDADDEAVAALTMAVGERNADVRRSAALALGRSHHALALPALQTAFELENDQLTRAMLLLAIGDHGGLAARNVLCAEVTTGSKAVRGFAALALGLWGRARADESVAAAIQKALAAERNRDQRGAYLLALGLLRHRASLDLLSDELTAGNTSPTRGAAAAALGMLGDGAALAVLARSLREDTCPEVRAKVARALTSLGLPAVETLRTAMRDDPASDVRGTAAFALGGIAEPGVAVALVELARDQGAPATARAGAALGLGRHFRCHEPQLPALRFQHDYTVLPALVAWAFGQEL